MKIGILGTSEIAFRRFLPALSKSEDFTYAGVASRTPEKGKPFREQFSGEVYDGYEALLADKSIEAVYVPLPPALHYEWGKKALQAGKHLFLEKPSTTSGKDTKALLELAAEKGLAVHENYMFQYHAQMKAVTDIAESGRIGQVRLYRLAFGFPKRGANDFRYDKVLGGGALLDCGGYTLKLAGLLLGDTAKVVYSHLNYTDEFSVDLYGSAALVNEAGVTTQVSFGMDNSYKCELEIWGSRGCVTTGRIFTASAGFEPTAEVKVGNETETVALPADDAFAGSIARFAECIRDEGARGENYRAILRQAELVDAVRGEA